MANIQQFKLLPLKGGDYLIYIEINGSIFGFNEDIHESKSITELYHELEVIISATPDKVAEYIYKHLKQVIGPIYPHRV